MENLKKNWLVIVVAVIIAIVGSAMFLGSKQGPPGPQGPQGSNGSDGQLSGLAGPDIPSPYLQWGGVYRYAVSAPMTATSSTVCSFQNPTGATSTLQTFTAAVTASGIATAMTFDIATSTNDNGTSSPAYIKEASFAAGALPIIAFTNGASTTARLIGSNQTTGKSDNIVGPSEYVNLKIATGTAGTFASYLTGTCHATFQVI